MVQPLNNKIFNVEVVKKGKGVFPYDFVDSWKKLEHKDLLNQEDLFDTLNNKSAPDQDYKQFCKMWNFLENPSIKTYLEFYLKSDVLLLADVFETFREISLKTYKLDPAKYTTTPGFAMDCLLSMTKVQLELITEYDMFLMVEKGMRGGVSGVTGDRYVDVEGKNFIFKKYRSILYWNYFQFERKNQET